MSEGAVSVCLLLREIRGISVRNVFGDQAGIELPVEDDPFLVRVWLKPHSGYFKGTRIPFKIQLPRNYPRGKPSVHCEISLYHPNVSSSVCFSMFSSEWHESYRLEHFINGLLWLLNNPNFDDALNGNVARKNYKMKVRKAVRGLLNSGDYVNCINNELGEEELKQLEEEDQLIMYPPPNAITPKPLRNNGQSIAALRFVTPSLRAPLGTLIQQHRQRATNSSTSPTNPPVFSPDLSQPSTTSSIQYQHTTCANFTSNVDRSRLSSVHNVRQYFQTLILAN